MSKFFIGKSYTKARLILLRYLEILLHPIKSPGRAQTHDMKKPCIIFMSIFHKQKKLFLLLVIMQMIFCRNKIRDRTGSRGQARGTTAWGTRDDGASGCFGLAVYCPCAKVNPSSPSKVYKFSVFTTSNPS